jgi:hypothetical protein
MLSLCASAHRRGGLDAVRERCRGGRLGQHFLPDFDLADDRAGIRVVAAFECDERLDVRRRASLP